MMHALARIKPAKLTPATVTDKSELRKAILKARADGHSLVDQEVEIGFRSIAVPLRRLDGTVIAALNIGVHSERSPLATMHKTLLPKLTETASRLQPQLI